MTTEMTMTISAAGATDIGGGRNKENQDMFHVDVGARRFCIADGHATHGRAAAVAACAAVAASAHAALAPIFEEAEAAVRSAMPAYGFSGDGGTTATVLQIDPDGTCRVGNVGDSEARYFDEDDGVGVSLTSDHSATSLEEFHRIRASFPATRFEFTRSSYQPVRPVFVSSADDWIMNPAGGYQYCTVRSDWSAYVIGPDGEQLAMTRALGDFNMKRGGVIATPHIEIAEPPASGVSRAIVIASDGLWDAMHYAEVRAIVRNPDFLGNAEAATAALMTAALAAGKRHFGAHCDNVTAVVIYMTCSGS